MFPDSAFLIGLLLSAENNITAPYSICSEFKNKFESEGFRLILFLCRGLALLQPSFKLPLFK